MKCDELVISGVGGGDLCMPMTNTVMFICVCVTR